jgi:hypothetical protein
VLRHDADRRCDVGRYIRNEHSIPHAVLSYKGFAENQKGETNPFWERDSVAKRPLKRLSFVAADEKAKSAWWPGSSGLNPEFYLFGVWAKITQMSFKNFLAISEKYRDRVIFPHRVRERFSMELHSLGEKLQGGSPDSH